MNDLQQLRKELALIAELEIARKRLIQSEQTFGQKLEKHRRVRVAELALHNYRVQLNAGTK